MIDEDDIRAMVRDAVERHLRRARPAPAPGAVSGHGAHSSHRILVLPAGADLDGPCMIEPGSSCSHCHYCQSYGH